VSSKRGSYSRNSKKLPSGGDRSVRPIADVARRLGWSSKLWNLGEGLPAEHVGEAESELPVSVRARVKELEREVRELRWRTNSWKIGGLLREEVSGEREIAFIAGEEGNYPIYKMCFGRRCPARFLRMADRAPSATGFAGKDWRRW